MTNTKRLSTGVPGLDEKIGGGLIPDTMTVLVGSSGIGKTQFGTQFLNAVNTDDERPGIIYDLTTRGDSQNHAEYAKKLFNRTLVAEATERRIDFDTFFSPDEQWGDYLRVLTSRGRKVTRRDLDFDEWHNWQAELSRRLDTTIGFFFHHFMHGVRRFIVDGIEPVEHKGESIQFELLEYIYHQIIRKEPEWVARDLFRQHYREHAVDIDANLYHKERIGCMVLYTAPETSLDALIERPLDEGDLLAGANTIIYLGKIRDGVKFRRAMYISKHRGSVCPDEILLYEIDDRGLKIL
ncbi:MAG: recombinase RecA [Planctomycetaceae bacterium]|jgi:KaiC/GvpD/RAD55 family RecA-like ATPase|nr:recombinase RecA [Planctomycetaceae bacterium]